jgi:hypothetical protein
MGNIVLWVGAIAETKSGEIDAPKDARAKLTTQQNFPKGASILWKFALSSSRYGYDDNSMFEQITLSKSQRMHS